jgi:hypothetical protein
VNDIRLLVLYGICLPAAVFLGYLLSTPLTLPSLVVVMAVFLMLTAPFLLHSHHIILISVWNTSMVMFLVPGKPQLWLLLAGCSLCISLVQRTLLKEMRFLRVSSVTWPLLMLLVVIFATAILSGGFGIRALGSETYGGRRYILLLGAIIGYFALTARKIPEQKVPLVVGLYFIGSITAVFGSLLAWVPPELYFLFYLFPPETFGLEMVGDEIVRSQSGVLRMHGLGFACVGVMSAMLSWWGIQGVFDIRRIWRLVLFIGLAFTSLVGGFRSAAIVIVSIFTLVFYFEGVHRTRLLPIFLLGSILACAIILPFANKLPLSVQRSLSFLPIDVDPRARFDAKASTEWRLEIWKRMLPEIPEHFFVGKGYALNPRDLEFAQEAMRRLGGDVHSREVAILAGDYHSGPLSIILPLGIFGVVAFLWFVMAALKVLYLNYKFSPPTLKFVNTFLLSCFIARLAYFVSIYGHFYSGLMVFTGLVGLSISINGGVRRSIQTEARSAKVHTIHQSRRSEPELAGVS